MHCPAAPRLETLAENIHHILRGFGILRQAFYIHLRAIDLTGCQQHAEVPPFEQSAGVGPEACHIWKPIRAFPGEWNLPSNFRCCVSCCERRVKVVSVRRKAEIMNSSGRFNFCPAETLTHPIGRWLSHGTYVAV